MEGSPQSNPFENQDLIAGVHEQVIGHALDQLDAGTLASISEALQALGALHLGMSPLSDRLVGTWVAALQTDGLASEYALYELVHAQDAGLLTEAEFRRIMYLARPERGGPDTV